MSCFGGRMREYENISIDRFDGFNLQSTAFFLSHCHEDHTVGLKEESFKERLNSRNDIFLYCSEVTKVLLKANPKYQFLEKYIRTLAVDTPKEIPVPEKDSAKVEIVTVTPLHAGHCPGSVMFLFEGSEGRVLYTGDFRWESSRVSLVQALHHDGRVKPLQSLYIDTTFCHPDSVFIPPRVECEVVACKLIKEWLNKNKENVVHVMSKTNYGHEPLLKVIAESTGRKVHVSDYKYRIYQQISELQDVYTPNAIETRIHACTWERSKFSKGGLPCCDQLSRDYVMRILPSTMFFTMAMRLQQTDVVIYRHGLHRVCYSFHSSLQEVRDLVMYLSPQRVRPNVKPVADPDLSVVQRRLNEFLKLKHSSVAKHDMESQRPLGLLKPGKVPKRKHKVSVSSDSEDLIFGTQTFEESHVKTSLHTSVKLSHDGPSGDRFTEDEHSSYAGSQGQDSEMSDLDIKSNSSYEEERLMSLSTPSRSLLELINSQPESEETLQCRMCISDDEECSFEQPLSLDKLNKMMELADDEKNGDPEMENDVRLTGRENSEMEDHHDDESVRKISTSIFCKNNTEVNAKLNNSGSTDRYQDTNEDIKEKRKLYDRCSDKIGDRNDRFDEEMGYRSNISVDINKTHSLTGKSREDKCNEEEGKNNSALNFDHKLINILEKNDNLNEGQQGDIFSTKEDNYCVAKKIIHDLGDNIDFKGDKYISKENDVVEEETFLAKVHCENLNTETNKLEMHCENSHDLFEDDESSDCLKNSIVSNDGISIHTPNSIVGDSNTTNGFKIENCSPMKSQGFHVEDNTTIGDLANVSKQKLKVDYPKRKTQDSISRNQTKKRKLNDKSGFASVDILFESDSSSEDEVNIIERPDNRVLGKHQELQLCSENNVEWPSGQKHQTLDLTVRSGETCSPKHFHGEHFDLTVSSGETTVSPQNSDPNSDLSASILHTSCHSNELDTTRGGTFYDLSQPTSSTKSDPVSLVHDQVIDCQSSSNNHDNHVITVEDYESDSDVTLPPTPRKFESDLLTFNKISGNSGKSSNQVYKQRNILQYLSPSKRNNPAPSYDVKSSPESVCSPDFIKKYKKSTINRWLNSGPKCSNEEMAKRKCRKVIDLTESDDDH